ncbi:metallophosphoesterase, partial [Candidatus Uhrbacteria bacterium]|nr:metallophosphoesterase [Candidatus Uhrbacteria bacterium]
LEALHEAGVIHQDIKPANILLEVRPTLFGDTIFGNAHLVDLGIAGFKTRNSSRRNFIRRFGNQLNGSSQKTPQGHHRRLSGSPAYFSPEIFRVEEGGAWSDIWALGATFYEVLTGNILFMRDDLNVVKTAVLKARIPRLRLRNQFIPSELEQIVRGMLKRNKKQRIQSAKVLAEELEQFLKKYTARQSSGEASSLGAGWVAGQAAAVAVNSRFKIVLDPQRLVHYFYPRKVEQLFQRARRIMKSSYVSEKLRPKDSEGNPGSLVRVPSGPEVQNVAVVGDIQGHYHHLVSLLLQPEIRSGLSEGSLQLVFVGDLIHPNGDLIQEDSSGEKWVVTPDAQLQSLAVLILWMQLKSAFPDQVHVLLGNHEATHIQDSDRNVFKWSLRQNRDFEKYLESLQRRAAAGQTVDLTKALSELLKTWPIVAEVQIGSEDLLVTHGGHSFDVAPALKWFGKSMEAGEQIYLSNNIPPNLSTRQDLANLLTLGAGHRRDNALLNLFILHRIFRPALLREFLNRMGYTGLIHGHTTIDRVEVFSGKHKFTSLVQRFALFDNRLVLDASMHPSFGYLMLAAHQPLPKSKRGTILWRKAQDAEGRPALHYIDPAHLESARAGASSLGASISDQVFPDSWTEADETALWSEVWETGERSTAASEEMGYYPEAIRAFLRKFFTSLAPLIAARTPGSLFQLLEIATGNGAGLEEAAGFFSGNSNIQLTGTDSAAPGRRLPEGARFVQTASEHLTRSFASGSLNAWMDIHGLYGDVPKTLFQLNHVMALGAPFASFSHHADSSFVQPDRHRIGFLFMMKKMKLLEALANYIEDPSGPNHQQVVTRIRFLTGMISDLSEQLAKCSTAESDGLEPMRHALKEALSLLKWHNPAQAGQAGVDGDQVRQEFREYLGHLKASWMRCWLLVEQAGRYGADNIDILLRQFERNGFEAQAVPGYVHPTDDEHRHMLLGWEITGKKVREVTEEPQIPRKRPTDQLPAGDSYRMVFSMPKSMSLLEHARNGLEQGRLVLLSGVFRNARMLLREPQNLSMLYFHNLSLTFLLWLYEFGQKTEDPNSRSKELGLVLISIREIISSAEGLAERTIQSGRPDLADRISQFELSQEIKYEIWREIVRIAEEQPALSEEAVLRQSLAVAGFAVRRLQQESPAPGFKQWEFIIEKLPASAASLGGRPNMRAEDRAVLEEGRALDLFKFLPPGQRKIIRRRLGGWS